MVWAGFSLDVKLFPGLSLLSLLTSCLDAVAMSHYPPLV